MATGGTIKGEVVGLVIAGGRSSRFGAEKAVQILAGRPLLDWALAALDGVCTAAAVNARAPSETFGLAKSMGREVIADDPAHPSGPLSGIAAGLGWAARQGARLLVTLPSDTPAVGAEHLAGLLAALGEASAAYAVSPSGPHPLCCVWRVDLEPRLAATLRQEGHPPVRRFLESVGALGVRFDDDGAFRNLNSRDDLDALASSLAGREAGNA